MTTVSSTSHSNPILGFASQFNIRDPKKKHTKKELQDVVNKNAPILTNELNRLFPDNNNFGFNDHGLRQMAENGWVLYNNEKMPVSENAREAARKLLEAGGFLRYQPERRQ